MAVITRMLGVAVLAFLLSAAAKADEAVLVQPEAVHPASLEVSTGLYAQPEAVPDELAADESELLDLAGCGVSCGSRGSSCGTCRCGRRDRLWGPLCCCQQEPRRLLPCGLPRLGVDVYGWIDAGMTVNDDRPASNFNGVIGFNDRHEEIQLNQAYLVFERAVKTGRCAGFSLGGRVDLLYGTDSRFVEPQGTGLGSDWNREEFYGLDLPQMYLELAYNRLSLKLGRFYTILGHESVMAPDNFFYSHSYAMLYGEPFTHTGMLASFAVNDKLTLLGGIDRGWDRFNGNPDRDNIGFLGGVTWQNGRGTEIALTGTVGSETANPFIPGLTDNRYMYSLVVTQPLGHRLTYVFQHDAGTQESGSPYTGLRAEWYGINQYLTYRLNCKWDLGVRFEWFRDDDGRVVHVMRDMGRRFGGSPIVPFGFAGNFYNVTFGANWKPTANLMVRPEVRLDWYEGISGFGPRPFDDGSDDEQVSFALDVVYRF